MRSRLGRLTTGRNDNASDNSEQAAESLDEGQGVVQDEEGEDGGEKGDGLRDGGHFPGVNVAQCYLLDDVAEAEVGDDIGGQDDH